MRILHLIPYKGLCPPKNGGALRCYHLLHQLARFHEVDLVVRQEHFEKNDEYALPSNVRIFTPASVKRKKDLFDLLPDKLSNALRYRWLNRSFFGKAHSTLLEFYPVCHHVLSHNQYDAVLFEHVSTLKLVPLVKRLSPGAIRLVDAHNVDHLLMAQTATTPEELRQVEAIKKAESMLYKQAHIVLACSELDSEIFKNINGNRIRSLVVPNGVDVTNRKFCQAKDPLTAKKILFCGSLDYTPNINGLLWFYNDVWPTVLSSQPDARLVVVGRRASPETFAAMLHDATVDFIGEVDDVVPYYYQTSIAIVPLHEGSGTRLKILEAMSLGNAIVSTSKGAEGIDYVANEHILIADQAQNFAESICKLLTDDETRENLRRKARQLAESKYDWNSIGQRLNEEIKKL